MQWGIQNKKEFKRKIPNIIRWAQMEMTDFLCNPYLFPYFQGFQRSPILWKLLLPNVTFDRQCINLNIILIYPLIFKIIIKLNLHVILVLHPPNIDYFKHYLWGVLKNGMFVLACVWFFKTPCIFGVFSCDPNIL